MTPDERLALESALMFRRKGFNPIPSKMDMKGPMYKFAEDHGWDKKFPDEWFSEETWEKRPTTNLQVLTGRPWRLLVIDLDGDEARYVWNQWGKTPETWTTHREDGASWHLWFRLPKDYPNALPAKFLWKGNGDHQGIERLCDKSLIVAPPSFHVKHKDCRYNFMGDYRSPRKLPLPADCPQWVLKLKPIEPERKVPVFVAPPRPTTRAVGPETILSRDAVLNCIPDKIALARELGLRFTGSVSPTGWAECHSFSRPDAKPSAAVHVQTGVYVDKGNHDTLPLFDLYAVMRGLPSWIDAKKELAERFS